MIAGPRDAAPAIACESWAAGLSLAPPSASRDTTGCSALRSAATEATISASAGGGSVAPGRRVRPEQQRADRRCSAQFRFLIGREEARRGDDLRNLGQLPSPVGERLGLGSAAGARISAVYGVVIGSFIRSRAVVTDSLFGFFRFSGSKSKLTRGRSARRDRSQDAAPAIIQRR